MKSHILIRLITLWVEIIILSFGYFYLKFDFNIIAIISLLLVQAFILYSNTKTLNATEQFSYLALECLTILEIIYFTGGITNPFISLLLIPIAISMMQLSRKLTIPIVMLCIIGYSLLYRHFIPIQLRENQSIKHLDGIDLHLMGMWASFVFSVIILVYFVYHLVDEMKLKEQKLTEINQKMRRNEQLISVSMLSAGAGHQLNTPLNSMKLLVDLIKNQLDTDDELQDDLNLLNSQIDVCQSIVKKLLQQNYEVPQEKSIKIILDTIQEQWLIFRPTYQIIYKINDNILNQRLTIDEGFYQAIFNLLNNAFESTQNHLPVELIIDEDEHHIYLSIKDQGAGISPELLNHCGLFKIHNSDKKNSNGWGILMSYASIERLGGSVFIQTNQPVGTEVCLQFSKTIKKS